MSGKFFAKAAAAALGVAAYAAPGAASAAAMAAKDKDDAQKMVAADGAEAGSRLISHTSVHDFAGTLQRLQSAIESRGFKTFAVVDHAAGAASIGSDLRPTTLIIFGNPKGGTPLLQAEQTLGAALPLKALVHETEAGAVIVSVTDIKAVLAAYGVEGQDARAGKISGVLEAVAGEATK